MRAKSMILLLIAGVCGLVASIGISQVLDRNKGTAPQEVEMGELFVAITDIDIGAKLDATNVKLDKWPKDRIPEGAINKLEELGDRFPRVRLYAGEPILVAKLMDAKDGVDRAAKIPEGYRVVSVKVTMDEVVSGLVQPGDRVDVVLFLRKGDGIAKTMSHTFLKDVRVFALNSETERATDAKDGETVAKTVSLLVKPDQVESVMLAAELGKLRLSLRRPNDPKAHEDGNGTGIEELLRGNDRIADDERPEERNKGGLAELLGQKSTPAPAAVPAEAPIVEAPKPQWKMTILSPSGNSQFEWTDPNKLPQAVTGDSPSGFTAPAVLPPAVAPPTAPAPAPAAEPTVETPEDK
ncbi:MAG TPA: Flp pilus assembly protein CpaB [Pirellulaceae bacterium]|nr:Flp pilus assembly protein CpaB [Pirellulaceae bacterium]